MTGAGEAMVMIKGSLYKASVSATAFRLLSLEGALYSRFPDRSVINATAWDF